MAQPAAPFPGARARLNPECRLHRAIAVPGIHTTLPALLPAWLISACTLAPGPPHPCCRPQAQGCQVMDRYTPGAAASRLENTKAHPDPADPRGQLGCACVHVWLGICVMPAAASAFCTSESSDPDAWTVHMLSSRHALAQLPRAPFPPPPHLLNHQARASVDHRMYAVKLRTDSGRAERAIEAVACVLGSVADLSGHGSAHQSDSAATISSKFLRWQPDYSQRQFARTWLSVRVRTPISWRS